MSIWTAIGDFFTGIVSPITDTIKHSRSMKNEERMGEINLLKVKYETAVALVKQGAENTHEWEMAQIKNAGYKDEFILIVIYWPIIKLFWMLPAREAVATLDDFPLWYTGLVLTISGAVYGIRNVLPVLNKWRGSK